MVVRNCARKGDGRSLKLSTATPERDQTPVPFLSSCPCLVSLPVPVPVAALSPRLSFLSSCPPGWSVLSVPVPVPGLPVPVSLSRSPCPGRSPCPTRTLSWSDGLPVPVPCCPVCVPVLCCC